MIAYSQQLSLQGHQNGFETLFTTPDFQVHTELEFLVQLFEQSDIQALSELYPSGYLHPHQQEEVSKYLSPVSFPDLDLDSFVKASQGTGGVYFVHDKSHSKSFVFKPQNEENDTTDGDGYLKEVAAFVLDDNFAGVPETSVTCLDNQIGSLQSFVEDSEDAEDFGPGVFPTQDIHRIGVLDLRVLNCDRHSGNMMRNKNTGNLTPIDHGSSFPCAFSGELKDVSFEWLSYPQAKEHFSMETLLKIEEIDLESDLEKLKEIGIKEGAQLSTWMGSTLLKLAAKRNKNLFEIGSMIQRQGDRSEPSKLELLYTSALLSVSIPGNGKGERDADFFQIFTRLAEELVSL